MKALIGRPAFSLMELLVTFAILAVLIALLTVAIQSARETANRTTCQNHLKQIGLALHLYESSQGSLPPGCSSLEGGDSYPAMSWMTRLLPYLDETALWEQSLQAFAANQFFETAPHYPILGRTLLIFTCPSDPRTLQPWDYGVFQVAFTAYLGVEGRDLFVKDGVLFLDSHISLNEITHGTSNTLVVGERPPSADHDLGWWYAGWGQQQDGSADLTLGVLEYNVLVPAPECPTGPSSYGPGAVDNQCDAFHFWSLHSGQGANFLFVDGSVQFIPYSAAAIMPALATRSGSEAVSWTN